MDMDELNGRYPDNNTEQPDTGEETRPEERPDAGEPTWEMPEDTPADERWRFLEEEKGIAEADALRELCRSAAEEVGKRCMEECGGDPAAAKEAYSRYWQGRRAGMQERLRQAEQEREEALLARLAAEFEALREQNPAVRDPDELPAAVLQTAVEEGIPLFDAYLRYEWGERRRAEAERLAAEKAAACSAGRLGDRPDRPAAEQEVFTAVFRAAVK